MSDQNVIADPTPATVAAPDASAVSAGGGDVSVIGGDGVDKLANQGHRPVAAPSDGPDVGVADAGHGKSAHVSHHEVEHGRNSKASDIDRRRSPLLSALDESKDELAKGAGMFAGFAALMGICTTAITSLMKVSGLSMLTTMEAGALSLTGPAGIAAGIIGTGVAGALWLAGNKFVKAYSAAREREDSRLNKAIGKVKDGLHHAKDKASEKAHGIEDAMVREIGELGVVAGSLKSHLGGTGTLVVIPEAALEAPSAAANQTVQRILEQGPRRAESLIDTHAPARTNAERLAARSQELMEQAASL